MSHRFHSFGCMRQFLSVYVDRVCVIALVTTLLSCGCTDVTSTGSAQPPRAQAGNSALPPPIQTGPAIEPAHAAQPPVDAAVGPVPGPEQTAPPQSSDPSDPVKLRRVIGKTTQDVRDAAKEEAKGAKRVQPRITGQDPISISGSAYANIVGRIEQLQIQDALNKFKALNDRYPKDFAEFHREIIKAYRIRLAQLPAYQEYGYDAVNHKLVILEYPDKKAQLLGGNQ